MLELGCMPTRTRALALLGAALGLPLLAQNALPDSLRFEAVTSGFILRETQSLAIQASGPWNIRMGTGPGDMLSLSKAKGAGNDVVAVGVQGWWLVRQKAGTYEQTLSVYPEGGDPSKGTTVHVTLRIAQAVPNPAVTYPDGPHGCTAVPELPDPATCVVPNERPPGRFQPPEVGTSYVDPNFGARVTVLTGPGALHGYSSPSAITARNRMVLVGKSGENQMVDLNTGSVLVRNVKAPLEGTILDAQDDAVAYAVGPAENHAAILRYDLATGKKTVLADFSKAPYRFSSITVGGTGEGSKDNWLPLSAPEQQQLCAYSVAARKAYCADLKSVPGGPFKVDFPTMSKGVDKTSGKRYVVAVANPAMLTFSVNEAAGSLELETVGPEQVGYGKGNANGICEAGERCIGGGHSDLFEDPRGNQLMMLGLEFTSPCEYDLVTLQLNQGVRMGLPVELGGGLRRVMTLFRCGGQDVWADLHIGCARSSPYCVVATTYGGFESARRPDDESPMRRTPHLSEIFVVRDNGAEIRRLAQHRSVQFTNEDSHGYWSTPRACLSADGAYVVADSNFGVPNAHRVIQIETGFGVAK